MSNNSTGKPYTPRSPPPPHPHSDSLIITFPSPHILLLTFNRPKSLNAMTQQMQEDMKIVLDWFENEPELWVVIVTGAGRFFCAGADLKSWNTDQQSGKTNDQSRVLSNPYGFGSLSRRQMTKPVIAAVNGGGAYGGGMEMVVNCDLVVAGRDAKFGFPEVRRGVVAVQGGIPRLARVVGHQLACELLLLGKIIDAVEARDRFGFVNMIVSPDDVVPAAIKLAQEIVENSPDAVQSTKQCLMIGQRVYDVREVVKVHTMDRTSTRVYKGENIKEGLKAFAEKRLPVWKNPAKL